MEESSNSNLSFYPSTEEAKSESVVEEDVQKPASIPISRPPPLTNDGVGINGAIKKKRTLRLWVNNQDDNIPASEKKSSAMEGTHDFLSYSFKSESNFLVRQDRSQEGIINITEERVYSESVVKKPMQEVETKKKKKVDNKDTRRYTYTLPDLNLVCDPADFDEGKDKYLGNKRKISHGNKTKKYDVASTSQKKVDHQKYSVPNPAPPLPNNVREEIEKSGALDGEPVLIIQRLLTKTDLSKHHNRMAIPVKQVKYNFLTEDEEKQMLEKVRDDDDDDKSKNVIVTDIIMPSLEKGEITLRRWEMKKKGGKSCDIYALSGNWNKLREKEKKMKEELELLVNMVLQVWAYRYRHNNTLRFALVNVGYHLRTQTPDNSMQQID